jgi:hypothetical protein
MLEPALYRHRTFHVPNIIPIFLSSGHLSEESVHVRRHLWHFVTKLFFAATNFIPKLEDNLSSSVRGRLFNIFAATLHTWRLSPSSATRGRAVPLWKGAHLTWLYIK